MMDTSLHRQIYDQYMIIERQPNEVTVSSSRSWFRIPTQGDLEKSLLENAREQRRLQRAVQTNPIQARGASKRISSRIAKAIQSSRSILDLEDDWDEEGSPGYKESTWVRATQFVKNTSLSFRQDTGFWVDPPRILPGPKGSIDIHWKTSKRELLINIPENDEEPADYYGSGGANDIIKGKLDTSSQQNFWILVWLTR
jgi:hypothetical protein